MADKTRDNRSGRRNVKLRDVHHVGASDRKRRETDGTELGRRRACGNDQRDHVNEESNVVEAHVGHGEEWGAPRPRSRRGMVEQLWREPLTRRLLSALLVH